MKYMGNKSALLQGELGQLLLNACSEGQRFVDLFAGSGSVSHFIAEKSITPVLSVDLQHYSRVLAASIIERVSKCTSDGIVTNWTIETSKQLHTDRHFKRLEIDLSNLTQTSVYEARVSSSKISFKNFITRHYGGHYFSPQQSYTMDRLFRNLPSSGISRIVGLAAILQTISLCAASPGHTAQPFQPTDKLLPHIRDMWKKDVILEVQQQVELICSRHALVIGKARIGNAIEVADELEATDIVFCDPPYSSEQYSRFYHVHEGVARGGWKEVSGTGRAPSLSMRDSSNFSLKAKATETMTCLLKKLRARSCQKVIITFPNVTASNGLSSNLISTIAQDQWNVFGKEVEAVHSTLGGNSTQGGRGGNRKVMESILVLTPK